MKFIVRASTALAALAAASTAYAQFVPPQGPIGAPPPPLHPPAPPWGYQPHPVVQPPQPQPQWQAPPQQQRPQPVPASFQQPQEDDQPIEPVEIPASIDQGIDLIYIDPDIAPEVKQRAGLLDKLDFQDWTGAPVDLFTAVNPYYTRLRQALVKYQQRWGDLPNVQVPAGATLKAGSTGDRVSLLRQRLGLAPGTAFDPALAKVVAEYQAAHGMKADGIAGGGTIASLNRGADHYQKVIILNMERALRLPTSEERGRYILVDSGAARLYMYENGKPVDSMKVIVGDAKTQTPMMAAQLQYVSLNPYWNVPPELVQSLVAKNVLQQGLTYLTERDYEVLSDWTDDATRIDPATIDWQAVASGQKELRVRRGPGPWNSMGQMKFMLPNDFGIYLHDVPEASKAAFAGENRWISNGCVRLEDAKRLQRWIFDGRTAQANGVPDQRVDLDRPVPVYMTYFTAEATPTGVAFRTDHYNRDEPLLARVKLDGSNRLASR